MITLLQYLHKAVITLSIIFLPQGSFFGIAYAKKKRPKLIDLNKVYEIRGDISRLREILLKQNNYNVNTKDFSGETVIMKVASTGHADLVDLLIKKGAKINIQSEEGKSPLMMAAYNGHVDVLKTLFKYGVNLHLRDQSGWNAYEYSKVFKLNKTPELIKKVEKLKNLRKFFYGKKYTAPVDKDEKIIRYCEKLKKRDVYKFYMITKEITVPIKVPSFVRKKIKKKITVQSKKKYKIPKKSIATKSKKSEVKKVSQKKKSTPVKETKIAKKKKPVEKTLKEKFISFFTDNAPTITKQITSKLSQFADYISSFQATDTEGKKEFSLFRPTQKPKQPSKKKEKLYIYPSKIKKSQQRPTTKKVLAQKKKKLSEKKGKLTAKKPTRKYEVKEKIVKSTKFIEKEVKVPITKTKYIKRQVSNFERQKVGDEIYEVFELCKNTPKYRPKKPMSNYKLVENFGFKVTRKNQIQQISSIKIILRYIDPGLKFSLKNAHIFKNLLFKNKDFRSLVYDIWGLEFRP